MSYIVDVVYLTTYQTGTARLVFRLTMRKRKTKRVVTDAKKMEICIITTDNIEIAETGFYIREITRDESFNIILRFAMAWRSAL